MGYLGGHNVGRALLTENRARAVDAAMCRTIPHADDLSWVPHNVGVALKGPSGYPCK